MLTALGHGWLNVGSRGKDARVQLDSTCELRRLAFAFGCHRTYRTCEQLDALTDTLISRTCQCLLRETGLTERRRGYVRRVAMD